VELFEMVELILIKAIERYSGMHVHNYHTHVCERAEESGTRGISARASA
jgi:hypothetical protein